MERSLHRCHRLGETCLSCQWAKVHCHVQVPPQHIPVPARRFSHIHVDLVGPLPASKGFTYLFTIIDRTSRWPEVIYRHHYNSRLRECTVSGMGESFRSPGSHNIRPQGPVHLLSVGRPLQLAQHPAQPDHCLPPTIQQDSGTLPPPPEGRPPRPLRRETGSTTSRGSSWASAQQPGKTTALPPLRQCSAHNSFYLANF
jgi:hypothetical protein